MFHNRKILRRVKEMPWEDSGFNFAFIGKEAPGFEVSGFDAVKGSFESYSLSSFKGRYVVLFFYPADFTYVCPTELVSIASLKDEFIKANAQIFVVSTDKHFTHKAWNTCELKDALDGEDFPYPMLSDALGKMGAPYKIFDEESGMDMRGTVLIDKRGVVQSININNASLGRNPKEILRLLLAMREHDDSGGLIPACWEPGDKVIEANLENSGNMLNNYKEVIQKSVIHGNNWALTRYLLNS